MVQHNSNSSNNITRDSQHNDSPNKLRRHSVSIAQLFRNNKAIPEENSFQTSATSLPFLIPLNDAESSSSKSVVTPSSGQSSPNKQRFRFSGMFGFSKAVTNHNDSETLTRQPSRRGEGSHGLKEYGTPTTQTHSGRKMRLLRSNSTLHEDECEDVAISEGSEASSSDPSLCHVPSHSSFSSISSTISSTSKYTGEAGLQIYLKDGHVRLGYCHDSNLSFIHPNVFAPSSLQNVERMGGGGSGVAVFCGTHPELGDIVMKHGGFKDLRELFALATIAEQLRQRGVANQQEEAAQTMQDCLPSFEMIYVSPYHIQPKKNEDFWSRLKKVAKVGNVLKFNSSDSSAKSLNDSVRLDSDTRFLTPGMSLRIYQRTDGRCSDDLCIILDDQDNHQRKPSLSFVVSPDSVKFLRTSTMEMVGMAEYKFLEQIYQQLMPIMTDNLFKFTLAQQRIGGPNAKTGNQWLYEKKLNGKLLDALVTQFCDKVHSLQKLTLPKERDVIEEIRDEVDLLEAQIFPPKADEISSIADQFCGNAIKKNFDPAKGRLRFAARVCKDIREHKLILTSEEKIPAQFLGRLFHTDALMSDTFIDASTEPPLVRPQGSYWLHLLCRAVDDRKGMCPNAIERIWNSGLADAGIHNLFVSETELYFFDLGEPTLMSMPGFMTKFLFSFFHTLGMQEDENGDWIRRFVRQGDKLALTPETKELLEQAYNAFEVALDGIIANVFDDDEGLRWILLQYVTLQLLSDAAFCLQRWEMKGGGSPRHGNHNTDLEKWLWRAIWDCYIAFDINTAESWFRFDVENPNFRDSMESVRQSLRQSMGSSGLQALEEFRRSSYGRPSLESSGNRMPQSPLMPSRSGFTEVSLRDLTVATYNLKRTDSLDSVDEELSGGTDMGDSGDDSDDGSAIEAPPQNDIY
jgi:hypothetical protein